MTKIHRELIRNLPDTALTSARDSTIKGLYSGFQKGITKNFPHVEDNSDRAQAYYRRKSNLANKCVTGATGYLRIPPKNFELEKSI